MLLPQFSANVIVNETPQRPAQISSGGGLSYLPRTQARTVTACGLCLLQGALPRVLPPACSPWSYTPAAPSPGPVCRPELSPICGLSLGPCVSDLGAILTLSGKGEAGQQPSQAQLSWAVSSCRAGCGREGVLGSQRTPAQTPAPSLIRCVTSGRLLCLSDPGVFAGTWGYFRPAM